MNSRFSTYISLVIPLAALSIPLGLAAQQNQAVAKKTQHHHYKLIVLGTLGGPQSFGDGGHGAGNLTNQGVAAGVADTSTPNPFYPNYNPLGFFPDPFLLHTFLSNGSKLVDLGALPGANSSSVSYITKNGLVSGQSLDGTIDPLTTWPAQHAVIWMDGQIVDLGTLGGYESGAGRGNNHGQVPGFSSNAVADNYSILGLGTETRAFVWDERNGMQDIGTLGGPDAFAFAINERGQAIGFSYESFAPASDCFGLVTGAFVWEKNKEMTDLGTLGGTCTVPADINEAGQIAGSSNLFGDTVSHAFLWENGRIKDIGGLGGTWAAPSALNDAGDIAGQAGATNGEYHAFFWSHGFMTDLGSLPGFDDTTCIGAFGINSHDQVTGQAMFNFCDPTQAQAAHAFLWENGSMIDLNTFVPKGTEITLNEVEQINDSGEMFGIGTLTDGNNRAFLLIPCDDDHPNVEGCDYSMVDAAEIADNAVAPQTRLAFQPAMDSFPRTINPSQTWFTQRHRMVGHRPVISH